MSITSIKSLLSTKQSILDAGLSTILDQCTTKGENCEGEWIEFFRSFLPSRYSVTKGYVFDSSGNRSDQIDIIIYDSIYSPLIFKTKAGDTYITAESVYAVFESKPNIDKEYLAYANKKIKSVLDLRRTSRGIINAGRECPPREKTKIIGGILATESIQAESVRECMRSVPFIDIGCAIKHHTFLVNRGENGELLDISFSDSKEVALSFFYLILNMLYEQGTVAAIDVREYANATLDSIQLASGRI